jgi:hypothetical protein
MWNNAAGDEAGPVDSTVSEETAREQQARRIRENQRRSRQKRKDHIEELQDKLRQCQAQGVEASAEIQVAARQVAEENKQLRTENIKLRSENTELQTENLAQRTENKGLRTMLSTFGIFDDSIQEFLASSTVIGPRHSVPSYPQRGPVGSSVQRLERLLEPRRPRCLEPSEPFCPPSSRHAPCPTPANAVVTVKSRETSIPTATPTWDVSAHRAALASSMASHQPQHRRPQPPQYTMAPDSGTTLSRTDAAMALTGLGQVDANRRSRGGPNLASASVSGGPLPTGPYNYTMQPFSGSSGYSQQQPNGQQLLLQSSAGPSAMSSNYLQTQSRENNCSMATDIISEMTGTDPHQVRGQLGCIPGNDCHVDNASFTNAMDRYTYQ